MKELQRQELFDCVAFNYITDNRFTTSLITVTMYMPLNIETVSEYSILVNLLTRTCKEYPDFTSMSKKLSSLYGATVSFDCEKVGDRLALRFNIKGIDDRYSFNNEKLSKELSELLCKIIFEPNVNDESFDEKEVEQCKREQIDMIDSLFNDKRIYALHSAISFMHEGEPFAISRFGTKENVKKVDGKSLYKAWKELIRKSKVEIYYIGENSPKMMIETFKSYFEKIDRSPVGLMNSPIKEHVGVRYKNEEMNLSQSKMILGFRTNCFEDEKTEIAELFMNSLLGRGAHSKLFNNVREKLSLCYYCSSRNNTHKATLIIESGVESKNIEKAKTAILGEIEAITKGEITDFEFNSTREFLVNNLYKISDSQNDIIDWYLSKTFNTKILSPQQYAELIKKVTKEEIVSVAKKLQLDTVYTLTAISEA